MTAKIIDGNAVARTIRDECRQRVQRIVAQSGVPPGLAVILVGSDPASRIYVKNKIRACADVGIRSFRFDYPIDVKQDDVVAKIAELNDDPAVHGILVQLPLPASFDMARILHTISADKDVDGFHLYNVGGLVVGGTVFPPCTPYGVLKLLEHENISLEGKNVVVVGRRLPEPDFAADGANRRGGGRRRHQSLSGRQTGRRCRFRPRRGKGLLYHASARRRRADDGVHALDQYDHLLRALASALVHCGCGRTAGAGRRPLTEIGPPRRPPEQA